MTQYDEAVSLPFLETGDAIPSLVSSSVLEEYQAKRR